MSKQLLRRCTERNLLFEEEIRSQGSGRGNNKCRRGLTYGRRKFNRENLEKKNYVLKILKPLLNLEQKQLKS